MRLLNRTAGRLSRHRRGPLAGLAVLLLGLLISGSLYTAFAPAQADEQASETEQVAQGKELFLASCAFCHGKNGEGIPTVRDGYQLGPSLVGVGAAAVDFQVGTGRMPHGPARASRRRASRPSSTTTRSPRWRPTSPRWAPARPSPTSPTTRSTGLSEDGAPGGDLPRRPDLPDQLHRLPQLQRRRWRDAARWLRPDACTASSGKYIFEALLTGPQAHAQLQQRQPLPRGEARRHRLPRQPPGHPRVRRLHASAASVPVSEGLFAWVIGIGGLVGAAVWIASHTTRTQEEQGERVSNDNSLDPGAPRQRTRRHPGALRDARARPPRRRADRRPGPAGRTRGVPPTSTPRPRSAPSARSRRCSSPRWSSPSSSWSPTSPSRSATTGTPSPGSAPRRSPSASPSASACCSSASASSTWPAS